MARTNFDHFAIASASAALRDMTDVSQSMRDLVGPSLRDMDTMSDIVDAARRQATVQLERMRPSISQAFERAGRAAEDARITLDLSGAGIDFERMAASIASSDMLQEARLSFEGLTKQFRLSESPVDVIRRALEATDFTGAQVLQSTLGSAEALQHYAHQSMTGVDYAIQAAQTAADTRQEMLEVAGAPLSFLDTHFQDLVNRQFDQFGLGSMASHLDTIQSVLSELQTGPAFDHVVAQLQSLEITEMSSWAAAKAVLKNVTWNDLADLAAERKKRPAKESKTRPQRSENVVNVNIAGGVTINLNEKGKSLDYYIALVTTLAALIALVDLMFGNGLAVRFGKLALVEPQKQELRLESRQWAVTIASVDTPLHSDSRADAPILAVAEPGAYISILELKENWALAEIQVGPKSKIRGWIEGGGYRLGHEALFEALAPLDSPPAPALALPLPSLVEHAGTEASACFVEFFRVVLQIPNTRLAYWHACTAFLAHCAAIGLTLESIAAEHVSHYVGELGMVRAAQTVKQHLAALRKMFDHLVSSQILPSNPAASVRSPKKANVAAEVTVLDDAQIRLLFSQFEPSLLSDARDRAILATMLYGFIRPSVITEMRVRDFEKDAETAWFIVDRKDGRPQRIRAHPTAAEFVKAYLVAAGTKDQSDTLLFRSLGRGRKGLPTTRGLRREEIYAMVRRRAAAVGLPANIGCQSLRGAGIANYLKNGGAVDSAAHLAGHAHISSTKLYDRQKKKTDGVDIDRMRF